MPERFDPLPDEAAVFRFASADSKLYPATAVRPSADWLLPSTADKAEAAARGRAAGLSCWQQDRTTVLAVTVLVDRPDASAFVAQVGHLRRVAADLAQETNAAVAVDVLHDPADTLSPRIGWDAHAVIEGFAKPTGQDKRVWTDLRLRAVEVFDSLE